MKWPNFTDYQDLLLQFYEATRYVPVWVQGAQPNSQAVALIDAFKNAENKGLDPEDYDASRWEERIRAPGKLVE